MTTAEEVQLEERDARRVLREEQKQERERARKAERKHRENLAVAIRESRKRFPRCECELNSHMTDEDLRAIHGCSHPNYICPRLAQVRRDVL